MIISQTYEDLIKNKDEKLNLVYIDVRSPIEYKESHIPNAINIPVFSDNEREEIGILYKQKGKRTAIRRALEIVGPKVLNLYLEFEKHFQKNTLMVVYCARGGMRSSAVTSLFKEFSLPLVRLKDGYKGYRQYINNELPEMFKTIKFVSLYGKTGSGKTNILKEIKNIGYDILDLEACANNRGSLLGGIGLGERYTQKTFESLVFESLLNRKTNLVFTEGESRRIGNIVMPKYMYDNLLNSQKIYINTPMENRVKIIKDEYVKIENSKDEMKEAINKLRKYASTKEVDTYIEQLNNDDYDNLIKDIIENYYDKVYSTKDKEFSIIFNNIDNKKCAKSICEYFLLD